MLISNTNRSISTLAILMGSRHFNLWNKKPLDTHVMQVLSSLAIKQCILASAIKMLAYNLQMLYKYPVLSILAFFNLQEGYTIGKRISALQIFDMQFMRFEVKILPWARSKLFRVSDSLPSTNLVGRPARDIYLAGIILFLCSILFPCTMYFVL